MADKALLDALRTAYSERALLFVSELRKKDLIGLIRRVQAIKQPSSWALSDLGIDPRAFQKVKKAGGTPHLVFCHPEVLAADKSLVEYYRNLCALSKKGLSQILKGLKATERSSVLVSTINQIMSAIVAEMDVFDLALAQAVIPLEFGAELQGKWVNTIGHGAARKVKELLRSYAEKNAFVADEGLKRKVGAGKISEERILLKNKWTITFAAEPDVAIRDSKGVLRVAIEIKGSMDIAGAQTRYGEAKKSFDKALREYAQCETMYLASCFTDAVVKQIREDARVRKVFNLVEVLADNGERQKFLDEIFKHQIRIGS